MYWVSNHSVFQLQIISLTLCSFHLRHLLKRLIVKQGGFARATGSDMLPLQVHYQCTTE